MQRVKFCKEYLRFTKTSTDYLFFKVSTHPVYNLYTTWNYTIKYTCYVKTMNKYKVFIGSCASYHIESLNKK